MKKILHTLVLILTLALFFRPDAFALLPNEPGGPADKDFDIAEKFTPAGKFDNVADLVTTIIYVLLFIAGALALIFIIMSGLQMVTSGGDEKKLSAASSRLTFAVIGIAVVVLAFIMVGLVQKFLGSSIGITN